MASTMVSSSVRLSDELYREVMRSMPIPTVDVLLFTEDLSQTLLFLRTSRPVHDVFYSLGGRVRKNESLIAAALRILHQEANMHVQPSALVLGGVVDEIFDDSMFDGINSHCINTVFGCTVSALMNITQGDKQHSESSWFPTNSSTLHHYIAEKVRLLIPLLRRRADHQHQHTTHPRIPPR